ncbi:DUF3768 domain-containing protein [Ferrovibrio sp.]|uniref:DUF3768 domain-containing protein n=1 Tax=Ferrovibrio sp. TaxID=1917215 RepID=UPI0035AEA271
MVLNNSASRVTRIRNLNDHFRRTMLGGKYVLTLGIRMLGSDAVAEVLRKVRTFDEFNVANDPHHEHDFGSFMHDGQKIFWKIDTYDKNLEFHSSDPSDPYKTMRILTIMLAEEY